MDPVLAQSADRQHQVRRGGDRRQGDPGVRQIRRQPVELPLGQSGHAEDMADGDLALQRQRPGAVDDRAQRLQPRRGPLVQMDVDAHAVPVRDAEDDVELLVERLVEPDRVDAADPVDRPGARRLLQKFLGARRTDHPVLRERDDLHVERVPQGPAGGSDALDAHQVVGGSDVDMGPHRAGALGDGMAHQAFRAHLQGVRSAW